MGDYLSQTVLLEHGVSVLCVSTYGAGALWGLVKAKELLIVTESLSAVMPSISFYAGCTMEDWRSWLRVHRRLSSSAMDMVAFRLAATIGVRRDVCQYVSLVSSLCTASVAGGFSGVPECECKLCMDDFLGVEKTEDVDGAVAECGVTGVCVHCVSSRMDSIHEESAQFHIGLVKQFADA